MMNVAWELKVVVVVVVSDVASLFSQLLCFFFGLENRHLKVSLSSGRIVVTKFPQQDTRCYFLSFITHTKWEKKKGKKINKEESESKE